MLESTSVLRDEGPEIGVLGTGRMGTRLAAMFAGAGRRVVLASRTPSRAADIVAKLNIPSLVAGSYAEALGAPAILPAIFIRDGLLDLVEQNAEAFEGKLVIDISNPFNDDYSDFLTPWDSSGAEELRKCLPRARLVGAFKNVFWAVFDDPLFDGTASDVLVVGDDEDAKREFFRLSEGTPFRYLDAGALKNARAIERLTMITGALGRDLGSYPRMNWRLLG
ncbi:NADPH-dependent F420 reductase [Sphingomonas edaphi]|uniref:Dinucleotide-binding enzyme n=1 Tax=Sphingomonas edaphi TaxID=2315689 RepID=A0A418PZ79_9SPHN|nr:NAD(P)-binding domain-containing protein [Sphingomonas edaphi]RIX27444.1 dinucleotide-binding enzyme [Sphingomonas edaphi]